MQARKGQVTEAHRPSDCVGDRCRLNDKMKGVVFKLPVTIEYMELLDELQLLRVRGFAVRIRDLGQCKSGCI